MADYPDLLYVTLAESDFRWPDGKMVNIQCIRSQQAL